MSGLLSMIGMQAELDYLMGDFPACFGDTPLAIPKGNIPSDKQKCQPKAQHEPFGWVKYTDKYISISAIDSNNDYESDFDDYTFADGTLFGVKVEE